MLMHVTGSLIVEQERKEYNQIKCSEKNVKFDPNLKRSILPKNLYLKTELQSY
jgi:hypothetical protein